MRTTAFIIALALGAVSSPVLAESSAGVPMNQTVVTYADLDLTKAAGRATLDERLKQAIRKVCRSDWSRSVRIGTEARRCKINLRKELTPMRDAIVADAQAKASRGILAANPR